MSEIQNVPCHLIQAGNNDRKTFDPIQLEELAASILLHGLAQPITVRPVAEGRFELVAGERRFRAVSQILVLDTVPALVRELDDEAAAGIMLLENTARADLDPMEEAHAYQSRMARFGWSADEVSVIAGVSAETVGKRLSLLDLHPDIQRLVAKRHMPLGHAEAMVRLDSYRQLIALRVFQSAKAMPLATFRTVVSDLLAEQSQDGLFDLESYWMEQAAELHLPKRGKHAQVNVPTRSDLPQPVFGNTDTTSAVIMRYIQTLSDSGFTDEAGAVGTLYTALIHSNSMALPPPGRLTIMHLHSIMKERKEYTVTQTVYTWGYTGRTLANLVSLLDKTDADLFDIRFSPRSRNAVWSGGNLAAELGDRYVHCRALGNSNYRGNSVRLVNFEAGRRQILDHPRPVILMCVCRSPDGCHRTAVGARLAAAGFAVQELSVPPKARQVSLWSNT